MWQDFFYFSKSERRAIVVLLAGLLVWVFVGIFTPSSEEVSPPTEAEIAEIQSFLQQVQQVEAEQKRKLTERRYPAWKKREVVLAPFDPNVADSGALLRLGLPPFLVHHILKYRRAGGVFREPGDLSRMYGLADSTYRRLEPYIVIGEASQPKRDTAQWLRERLAKRDSVPVFKYPEGTRIDLNRADTTELKKIPGIGSGIARMIVAYRNRLGGFYAVDQLQEIEYADSSLLKWFVVSTDSIRRIPVNQAGIDRLRNHPYLNFYQAKIIVEYRRKRGKLKNLSQLSLYEEFTQKDLQRLSPYLSFE